MKCSLKLNWTLIGVIGLLNIITAQVTIEPKYKVGDKFEAKEIRNSLGDVVIQLDTFANKALVFNFWVIECQGCVAELPYLNSIYEQYQDHGDEIQFISVTASGGDRLENFLVEHPIDWDDVISQVDFMGLDGYELFEVRCMPTTMVVGDDRMVKYINCGILNQDNTQEFFDVIGTLI